MGSWALQFIVAVLRSRDYAAISRYKITPAIIPAEVRPLLQYIVNYFENRRTYGSLPPLDLLEQHFPTLGLNEVTPSSGDLQVLGDMIHREDLAATLRTEALNIHRYAETDPYSGLERLRRLAFELNQTHGETASDLILSGSADRVTSELRLIIESDGLVGIPWVWEELNRVTRGLRKGDMVGIYGRPKSMKSHIKILQAAYAYSRGWRVLWCNTGDMDKVQVERRVALALMQWDYGAVMSNPTLEHIQLLEDELNSLKETEEFEAEALNRTRTKNFVTVDAFTPSELRAKIEEIRPDLVLIDTANEMIDDQGSKKDNVRQANVARAIRKMSRDERLGTPAVLYSVHANREGETEIAYGYNEIGGSDQWGKTSDLLLRNIRIKTDEGWVIALLPPAGGGREVVWDGMLIGAGAYHNMGYIRNTNREDVLELIKQARGDSGGARERTPAAPRGNTRTNTPNAPTLANASWVNHTEE